MASGRYPIPNAINMVFRVIMFKASFELQYLRFLESKASFGHFSLALQFNSARVFGLKIRLNQCRLKAPTFGIRVPLKS
jgi:hypothetical protein